MQVALLTSNNRSKTELETINLLLDHGLDILHVKKRKFSRKKTKAFLKGIPKQYRKRVILHKHHWLAVTLKLKGIHLGRRDRRRPVRTALKIFFFRLFHPGLQVTTSFHSLQSCLSDNRKYHHVLLSPIFDSISKKNYSPAFSEKQLVSVNEKSKHRIFALGGVDIDTIIPAKETGFQGVVLYGSIWKSKNNKIKEFRDMLKKAKSPIKHAPEVKMNPVKISLPSS